MPGRLGRLALLSVVAMLLPASASASAPAPAASAACPEQPTIRAFAPWGDSADYVPVPGGTFEFGNTWSATGSAALVGENEPFGIGGPGGWSVGLNAGDSVMSPALCLSRFQPYARFVARATDAKSRLGIEVLFVGANGKGHALPLRPQLGDEYAQWAPSPEIDLKKVLPKDDEVRDVQLRLSNDGKDRAGQWLIDAVFVDPVMRG